jgi:F-type H+-transporting ATPase subunit b
MTLAHSAARFAFVVVAALALCAPAFADAHAAPAAPAAHGSGGHAAGGHGGEQDSLNFLALKRYDLGIYTIIVFALLIGIVSQFAWPQIKEGLEKREKNIASALEEARKDRDEAKTALAEAKKQLDAAALQVKAMIDEARRDAEALKVAEREAGVKDAAAERERAKREIETARDAALKDIYEQAVKLAAMMSEKALSRSITEDDHRRLLDESIAELTGAANKA